MLYSLAAALAADIIHCGRESFSWRLDSAAVRATPLRLTHLHTIRMFPPPQQWVMGCDRALAVGAFLRGFVCKDLFAWACLRGLVFLGVWIVCKVLFARICSERFVCKDLFARICLQGFVCMVVFARLSLYIASRLHSPLYWWSIRVNCSTDSIL